MSTASEQQRVNDVVLWELAQQHGWCREVKTIKEDSGATADLEIGQVLEDDTGLIPVATGALAEAILLERVTEATLKAGDSTAVCLTRGPALVVEDALIIAGGQEEDAKTALAALDIELREHPAEMSEGVEKLPE